jgi:hypothetical protein
VEDKKYPDSIGLTEKSFQGRMGRLFDFFDRPPANTDTSENNYGRKEVSTRDNADDFSSGEWFDHGFADLNC